MKSVGIGDTVMGETGNVTCAEKQHAGSNRPASHSPIHISKDEVKLTNLTQAASRKRIKSVIKKNDGSLLFITQLKKSKTNKLKYLQHTPHQFHLKL